MGDQRSVYCQSILTTKIWGITMCNKINTLRPRQNGCHFADDILKCIFLNENVWIPIKISLKSAPKGPINNIPALVQIMAWRRPGDKPLSEPTMVSLLMQICATRPQWVNTMMIHCFCQSNTQILKCYMNFLTWNDIIIQNELWRLFKLLYKRGKSFQNFMGKVTLSSYFML